MNFLRLFFKSYLNPLLCALGLAAISQARLGADTNDTFVQSIVMDAEQNAELNPGDPIRYTVTYGREPASSGAQHQQQNVRISIVLSTDGDPDNRNNFLLDFFNDSFPANTAIGEIRTETIINRLPPNFTGTYYLLAKIHAQGSAISANVGGDPDANNNFPAFIFTSTTRVTIRSADSATVDRVSTSTTGGDANELSESPSITADGRYVVFHSEATNIVSSPAAIAGVSQIYLKDNLTGEVRMISQLGGQAGNTESKYPVISSNGTLDPVAGTPRYYIAYQSSATNLISGVGAVDANQQTDIFLYDVANGTTTLASVPNTAPFGQQANGGSFLPSISGDGNLIVFESRATNLLGSINGITLDTNGRSDIFVYNRTTKAVTAASATAAGVLGNADSTQARISEDGSTVVFKTNAGNLTAGVSVTMPVAEVVAKTLVSGSSTGTISRISAIREAVGSVARSLVPFNRDSFDAAISSDGRYIAFASRASNTTAPDGQGNVLGYSQVYVVNRAVNLPLGVLPTPSLYDQVGNVSLNVVSVSTDPLEALPGFANNESLAPTISGNGRYIGFRTEADDLLPSVLVRSDGRSFQTANSGLIFVDPTNIDPAAISGAPIDMPVVNITDSTGTGTGAAAYAIVEGGSVVSIVVTNRGSGYSTTANDVTVELVGGQIAGGAVAEATAVVGTAGQDAGRITAINVRSGGSGYATAFVSITDGVGNGATGTATLQGDGVKDVSVVDSGFGYLPDRVSVLFSAPDDPAGTFPTAVAVVENGKVYDVVVTAPGSGYLSAPVVNITSTPQVQAEATADLAQGAIRSVTITNTGAGYVTTPTVEITVLDASGVNTYQVDPADITISSGLATSEVSRFSDRNQSSDVYIRDTGIRSIVVTEAGSGYTDSFILEGAAIQGGGGSGARAWAVVENGVVSRIDLLNTGAGYLSEPLITLPAPAGGGVQAVARAVMNEGAERVSLSHYGQETIGLIGGFEVPSSRSITMSSNGRYMLFTSEAANTSGFIFGKSNQIPLDGNSKRDIFIVNRRVDEAVTPVIGIAPTVTVTVDNRDLSFNSTRVISATAFDGGDANVDVSGVQTPREGVIKKIEIYANNRIIAESEIGTSSRLVLDTTWTGPQVSGPAQIYAVAIDGNGNRAFATPRIVNVVAPVSQRPSVTLSANETTLNVGSTVNLVATTTDPENQIAAVYFYSNGLLLNIDSAAPYAYSYTPTTSGDYKLTATVVDGGAPVVDANGNISFGGTRNDAISNELTLRILPPPSPTVSIVSPSDALIGASVGQPVFLEITATTTNPNASIASVSLRANGLPLSGTAVREGITSTYRYTWYPASAGSFSLVSVATDSQQGVGESIARNFNVLAAVPTAPTVDIVSPVAGSTPILTQQTVTFKISATDADGAISSVILYGNGARIGNAVLNAGSGFWELNVDASLLQTGLYDFVAVAEDNGGNLTGSLVRSISVQTSAPLAQIVSPAPAVVGGVIDLKRGQATPILVSASSSDALSRITAVTLSLDGTAIGTAAQIGDSVEYSLVWTPDTTGVFKLLATAADSKGGSIQTSDVTVRVTEPVGSLPFITLLAPSVTAGDNNQPSALTVGRASTLYASADALDTDGTISSVRFYLSGKQVATGTLYGNRLYEASINLSSFAVGSYQLSAIAVDNSGNSRLSALRTINIVAGNGASAPTLNLAVPVPSSVVEGRSTLLAASSTPATGTTISSVAFYVNGALVNTDVTAPYSFSYPAPAVGSYTVRAVATDSAGNTSVSREQSLTVTANAGPVVSISAPVLTVELGTPLAISATATDPDGIDRVVFTEYLGTAINDAIKTTEDRLDPYGYQFNPSQTGQYIIRALAFDDLGFFDSVSLVVNVLRNTAKPTIAFVSPAVGATAVVGQATPVEVSVTVPTGATVNSISFYANGVKIGDGYKQGTLDLYRLLVDQNNTQLPWSPSVTGSLALTAEIVDSFGGRAETAVARQIQVVGQVGALPFVEIIQPVPPATTTGGTPASLTATTNSDLNLAASAVDSDGTVSSVEFFLDRGRPATPTATVTFPSVVVNGAALQQSTGYISSIAFADGGTGYLSPPEVRIIGDGVGATAEAEILNGAISRIRVTNRGSGYTNAIVRLVGGGLVENLSIGSAVRDFSSDVWRLATPFNFKAYGAGFYTFRAVARDNNNNVQSSAEVSVTVSPAPLTTPVTGNVVSTPSTANLDGQRVPAGQTVQLALNPTVVGGSVASVEFFANGESVGIDTAQPYVVNWVPSYVGSYNVVAVVTDSARNQAVSPALAVYVGGNIAPTVTMVRPGSAGAGGVINQDVLLEAEATALTSGATVSSVEFIADGDSIGIAQQVGVSNRYVLSNWRPAVAKTYGITARVTDSFGQAALATVRNLVVTAQVGVVPTVIVTSPSGSTASGGSGVGGTSGGVSVSNNSALYLSAQANDADGSVASVEFLLSRGQHAVANWKTVEIAGILYPTLTLESPGSGYLYAPLVKIVGNGVGAVAEVDFADGQVTNIRLVSRGSGYTAVPQVVFEGGGLYENTSIGFASLTTGTRSWTYSLDLRNYDVGPYSIRARVTDNNGNTSISDPVAVTVTAATTGAPTLTLGQPVPTSVVLGRSVTLSAFPIAAPGASISSVAFYSNGYLIGQTTGAATTSTGGTTDPFQPTTPTAPNTPTLVGSSYSFVYTPPSSGSYTITAMVTDSAGNTALSAGSVVVTAVDNGAPQVTTFVMGTPATRFIGENVTVSATATDDQGVASVSLYVNNTLLETRTAAPYSFQHTPATEGSYIYTVTATDQLGKTGTYATAQVVTVIRSTLANVNTSSGNALNSVDGYYQSLLGRSPTRGELAVLESMVSSGITTEDYDYAMAKLAADLVRLEEFTKRGGASVILCYAAVLGRYPTPSEYAAGITSIQASGDVLFIAQLLARGEYTQQFGNTQVATTISANQYAAVRALALRLYQGLYGVAPKANVANAAAQSLLVSINGLGVGTTDSTTPAVGPVTGEVTGGANGDVTGVITSLSDLVLANTISTYLTTQRASKDAALIDNRIRVVALYLAMDEVPAFADVTARQRSNIEVAADNIYNDAPLVESRPVFRLNPKSTSFVAGASTTLTVEVAASPRATLQWFKDRVPVQGATGKSLQVTTAGNYYVVATNAKGRVTSRTAKVAVTPLPPSVPSSVVLATRGAALASSIDTQPVGAAGLSFFARGLPTGLSIDRFSGRISGIVSERVRVQDYSIQVWTQSGTQRSETRAFIIRVR